MLWFRKKEFNFHEFIVKELGFIKNLEADGCTNYIKGNYMIMVYESDNISGHDVVYMNYKSTNLFKMKFLPKSSIVAESLIKQAFLVDVR